ncbi:hypothetical protein GGC65_003432 [Sphingopyxis sp. OAS728]|uniref:hypothetical protein n=1 Tax=Sphingopyxis sp. OAS728 TaxID=2663823 RepID=UPI00178BA694|nr:hypothetical protein [Sphingopyxis sp. OAS728]MBE1528976.1 hypothetical protein [Sphingopyxis sp. OAS728]
MTLKMMAAATLLLLASGCSDKPTPAEVPETESGAVDFKSVDPPAAQNASDATPEDEAKLD